MNDPIPTPPTPTNQPEHIDECDSCGSDQHELTLRDIDDTLLELCPYCDPLRDQSPSETVAAVLGEIRTEIGERRDLRDSADDEEMRQYFEGLMDADKDTLERFKQRGFIPKGGLLQG